MIDIVWIIVLTLTALLSRIVNLLKVPIFTDEAIYIRWAQIGLADPAHRFISLTDGKQPLFTWFMYPALKIFDNPLFAGRIISVFSGIFAVAGIYLLAKELFGRTTARLASLIYLISPFAIVYDRLALMDSLLAAIGIWSLYLEVMLIKKPRLDLSLILGFTIGLGVLTKSSALFSLYLLPFSLVIFDFKSKKIIRLFAKWLGFGCISFIIIQVMYNLLRLSPWFYLVKQKNYSFILTLPEFMKAPFALFMPNLNGLIPMLISYLTWPVFIAVAAGAITALIRKERKILLLLVWFIFPFLSLAAFGKVIFPRFMLFMVYPLFIIAAYLLSETINWSKRISKPFVLIIPAVLFYAFFQSLVLIINPVYADIPKSDRNQLFDDWPSGYGVNEVISYIKNKSLEGKVVLGTEGTFGLNPAVYEIYLGTNKNVEIHGFWPVSEVPEILIKSANDHPTYLVFKESQDIPKSWPLTLIAKYRRGLGNTYLYFYQVHAGVFQ